MWQRSHSALATNLLSAGTPVNPGLFHKGFLRLCPFLTISSYGPPVDGIANVAHELAK